MTLLEGFVFSQRNLQDYVDCPRRFQLRYLYRLSWPAVEVEPALEHERRLRQGALFHKMVHQHLLGIPSDRISESITDEDLRRWWTNYLTTKPADLPGDKYPEITVASSIQGRGLSAKYDLLVASAVNEVVILDWKTSDHLPDLEWHRNRLQTRVYRYLLLTAGSNLLKDGEFSPDAIEMVYWYAGFPDQPVSLPYNSKQAELDEEYLSALIKEITSLEDDEFPLTEHEHRCRFCAYRSYCDRGEEAGPLYEFPEYFDEDADLDIDFDFDQIAEIEI